MSADLPDEIPASETVAPPLRPVLGSPAELPESWIRLAVARARGKQEPLPHSLLGVIALGIAILASGPLLVCLADAWQALPQFKQHPVGPWPLFYSSSIIVKAVPYLFVALVMAFVMGFSSLFFRRTRKGTGVVAMGLAGVTVVLYIGFVIELILSTTTGMTK